MELFGPTISEKLFFEVSILPFLVFPILQIFHYFSFGGLKLLCSVPLNILRLI
jgi:hypothetical protein